MTIIVHDCPFCNAGNVEIDECAPDEFAVECMECRCIGPITGDVMSAVAAWNAAPRFTAHHEP